jgi:hypothetical protein
VIIESMMADGSYLEEKVGWIRWMEIHDRRLGGWWGTGEGGEGEPFFYHRTTICVIV